MRDALLVAAISLLLMGALEAGLRTTYAVRNAAVSAVVLPYTAAQDWGPTPPWLDGLRILENDPVLLWRNRSGVSRRYLDVYGPAHDESERLELLQRFWPHVPKALQQNPTWSVAIGSRGFRTSEFSETKPPATLRIACVGDSWTFGANVDQKDAYPQALARLLREEAPAREVEVLNLGVMGYSSRQGLELLRRRVLPLAPDVVVIGFAMNDSVVAGWHDADSIGGPPAKAPGWIESLEVTRLVNYIAQRLQHETWTIGDYFERVSAAAGTDDELWTGRQAVEFANPEALERLARVPPTAYEANLREMVRLVHEQGTQAILLYNELWDTPYRAAVERVAKEAGVAWVDTATLIEDERRRRETALAERFRLLPAGADSTEVVLRVHQGEYAVSDALYVAGSHPAVGAIPNRVALHDDGTHGDERAGDGVWSLGIRVEPGERIFYVYTNSGREGVWEGLDVPDLRHLAVTQHGYRPIESFGRLTLQADGWHTNAEGYEMLARAIRTELRSSEP